MAPLTRTSAACCGRLLSQRERVPPREIRGSVAQHCGYEGCVRGEVRVQNGTVQPSGRHTERTGQRGPALANLVEARGADARGDSPRAAFR